MDYGITDSSKFLNNKTVKNQVKTDNKKNPASPPKIFVFDDHADKIVKVDPDNIPDISHGKAIGLYIKAQCPAVGITKGGKLTPITKADIKKQYLEAKNLLEKGAPEEKLLFGEIAHTIVENPDENYGFNKRNGLKKLAKDVENGARYDAVNLSMGEIIRIEDLAKVTGLPLTRSNLAQYKDKVREWFKNSKLPSIKKENEQLESIERVTAKGIPFYISGGNSGKNYVNLLSFAKGVTTVGALVGDEKADYSANNSLVTKWSQGDYIVNRIEDKKGKLIGYDINDDNKVDVLAKETSGGENPFNDDEDSPYPNNKILRNIFASEVLSGTSYAAPSAIGEDLREKYGDACGE